MEPEAIPDEDRLFYRVPRNQLREDELHEGIFRDRGDGMSVDWEEYATPHETRARGRKPASDYGIITMTAGGVRAIRTPPLSVVHEPLEDNPAHSGVHGINGNKTLARLKLFALLEGWEIHPSKPAE